MITASAVIASPLANADAAYLSSGTWSLMGFESKHPYTSEQAQRANITNEGGAERPLPGAEKYHGSVGCCSAF
ncbi:Rhamnulokinase [Kluyvera cryocrescens]|uniref:Rhamnulokinase n=1 Tax=Kluyvera cryocrescens TaxID=580 RepID=A0A485B5T5_KLUCR|nr:Rhamnulokinase [Kluyvera cryocrescens]